MSWFDIIKIRMPFMSQKMKWDTSATPLNNEQELRKNVSVDNIERRVLKNSFYVPPNPTDHISIGKIARIKEGVKQGVAFQPITIGFAMNKTDITFTDGRHRFAVAREMGLKSIPAFMYKEAEMP